MMDFFYADCLKPVLNHTHHWLIVRALPQRSYAAIFILANVPSAPQISLPSQSGHTSPSVAFFVARYSDCFSLSFLHLYFGDCDSGTLFSLLLSAWIFIAASHRVVASFASDDPHSKHVNFMFFFFLHRCDAAYGASKCTFCSSSSQTLNSFF